MKPAGGYRASRWKTRPEPPKKIHMDPMDPHESTAIHPRGMLDRAHNQEECERHRRCNPKFGVGRGSVCRPKWTHRPEL